MLLHNILWKIFLSLSFFFFFASSGFAADFDCRNVDACPPSIDPCGCDKATELTLEGPEIFTQGAKYSASGGRVIYTYTVDPKETSADYINPESGIVIQTPVNPSVCPMRIKVTATDACLQEKTFDAIVPSSQPSEFLAIAGPEEPAVGDVYTASGGTPPYSFNFLGGEINRDTGEILSITRCGGPDGNGAVGKVGVIDQCLMEDSMDVRLTGGRWILESTEYGREGVIPSCGGYYSYDFTSETFNADTRTVDTYCCTSANSPYGVTCNLFIWACCTNCTLSSIAPQLDGDYFETQIWKRAYHMARRIYVWECQ